jgi:hypothetical protein
MLALDIAGAHAIAAEPGQTAVVTGLNHVPVAVENLEEATNRFRALGFSIKPGRPHTNGIRNQHVKFSDYTGIELITAAEATDSLTARYRSHLAQGDGPAFVAFTAPSLDALAERLTAAPESLIKSEGMATFEESSELYYIFFGRIGPVATDRPEYFVHENTAQSLIGIWIASENPSAEQDLLKRLGAKIRKEPVRAPDQITCPVARFAEGEVLLLPARYQRVRGRRIVGLTVRVRDIKAAEQSLNAHGLHSPKIVDSRSSRSLFLPPSMANGTWLEFRSVTTAQ